MTLLNTLNIGGTGYGIQNNLPMGTCATPAGTEVKAAVFADDFELSVGNLISVTFTYANTYGDGSTTYPKLTVNGTTYSIKYPTGGYVGNGAWANGQIVTFMCDGTNLIITAPVVDRIDITESAAPSSKAVAAALALKQPLPDFSSITLLDQNEATDTNKSGSFTVTKTALVLLWNAGTTYSTFSQVAYSRIIVSGRVVCSYNTDTVGAGQHCILPSGTSFTYDLRANNRLVMNIGYKYLE